MMAWVVRLTAVAISLQVFETLAIYSVLNEKGAWRWQTVRRDFEMWPRPIRSFLDFLFWRQVVFGQNLFSILFFSIPVVCVSGSFFGFLHPSSWIWAYFFVIYCLSAIRWGGGFNGGSDSMTVQILGALAVCSIFPGEAWASRLAVMYIGVQVALSYFVAGAVKIFDLDWRTGRALPAFLGSTHYDVPVHVRQWGRKHIVALISSWAILLFECGFPLAIFRPQTTSYFLVAGVLFHLMNVYVFGLNRFFWIWIAGYPAILELSKIVN